jgi:hypothetical protein
MHAREEATRRGRLMLALADFGRAVEVIAFTSVAANLAAITGGILVFRDPIGVGAPAIVSRVIAFGLVIVGAALMPAPVRADSRSTIQRAT